MALVGTGTTVTFGTSGYTAELLSVTGGGGERAALDSTHMGTTTYRAMQPVSLVSLKPITLEVRVDPDDQPPIAAAAETVTITFPIPSGGASGATLQVSAFVSDWDLSVPLEDYITASITLTPNGTTYTWTDSA